MTGITVPGEQDSSSLNPNIQEEKFVERAVEKGWKPLEDFKGPEADWVDAKEFLAREPLLKEVRDLKRHIKTQREQMDNDMRVISAQFTQMSDLAYKKAVADLEAQRDLAISEQDIQSVRKLDKEIDEVEDAHQKNIAQTRPQQRIASEAAEEMQQWRQDNPWFDNDKELNDEAVSIGVGYITKHPEKSQTDMLKHVEDRVRRLYPEKFKPVQRTQVEEDNTRVEGRSPTRPLGKAKGKLTVADLDDDEREIMRTLIKRNTLKGIAEKNKRTQQEEFLAQLAERKAK